MLGAMTYRYRKLIEASEIKGAMNGWQAARTLGMRPEDAEIALRAAQNFEGNCCLDCRHWKTPTID